MTEFEDDLIKRLWAASHDERPSTGLSYREAVAEIARLHGKEAPCADSAKPQDLSSPEPWPLPDPVPTSSLVDVINRNSRAIEQLALVMSMILETLDPDGLNDDDETTDKPQYLSPHRPGRG
jgi:hypothetical protein